MPFEGVLDYAAFSIRIPEADVEQLDALLRAVPAARKVREYVRECVRTRASRPAASALHGSFLPCFLPSLPPCVHPYFLSSLLAYHLPLISAARQAAMRAAMATLWTRFTYAKSILQPDAWLPRPELPRDYLKVPPPPLATTCYSLLTTHYSLLTTHYALRTTHYLLVWYYLLTTSRCRRCPHSPTSSRAAPPARRRAHGLRAVGCCTARRWPTRTDQRWLRGRSLFPVRRTPRPTRWTRSSCSLPAGWTCHDRAPDQHATNCTNYIVPRYFNLLVYFFLVSCPAAPPHHGVP